MVITINGASFTLDLDTILIWALVGLVAGFLASHVALGHGLGLLAASLGIYLWPMAAIAAFGMLLSTITRNSAAAVVGALMIALVLQIGSIIPGLEEIRPYLLPRQFDAWQGLLREPTDRAPIGRAAWVCAAYAVPSLFAAYLVFLRRDVAGG